MFYSGDSYIVLNVWKHNDALQYDAHFWIGKYSTQDEYATAAYKTVELDTFLKDAAIQHRELEGIESTKFLSYFPKYTTLDGGVDSGFNHVKPHEYKPRLLHISGNRQKNLCVRQVPLSSRLLDPGDVFILDLGLMIYQWNGVKSSKDERFKALDYIVKLIDLRNGRPKKEVLESEDTPPDHEFFTNLPDVDPGVVSKAHGPKEITLVLHRLSDASGTLQFEKVAEGSAVKRSQVMEDDVFILDNGATCFVYIGKGASPTERSNAMPVAHNYLKSTDHPLATVTAVKGGIYCPDFEQMFKHAQH